MSNSSKLDTAVLPQGLRTSNIIPRNNLGTVRKDGLLLKYWYLLEVSPRAGI